MTLVALLLVCYTTEVSQIVTFNEIRDIFWPVLEPKAKPEDVPKVLDVLDIDPSSLDLVYDWAKEYYSYEEERRQNVESKSTILIGTLGVLSAIITVVANNIISCQAVEDLSSRSIIPGVILLVGIAYYCRALFYAISTLKKRPYHLIGDKEFIIRAQNSEYKEHIIKNLIKMSKANADLTNLKVDDMTMAQEFFKRAIITISFFAFVLLTMPMAFKLSSSIPGSFVMLLDVVVKYGPVGLIMLFFSILTFGVALIIARSKN